MSDEQEISQPPELPDTATINSAQESATDQDDSAATWISYQDEEGKTHRVKTKNYGRTQSEPTFVSYTDADGKTVRVTSEQYKNLEGI